MSTKIITNFTYNGPRFLDSRQSSVSKKEDLKSWDTLIPEGFQVYVEGEWYIYLPQLELDPVTGAFHKLFSDSMDGIRKGTGISGEFVASEIDKIYGKYNDIYKAAYPLKWKYLEGGGYYEYGASLTPRLVWAAERGEEEVVPDEITVNGSTEGILSDLKAYRAPSSIMVSTAYEVEFTQDEETISHIFEYHFSSPRYYGVSEYAYMDSSRVRGLGKSDWGQNNELGLTSFDCSGGRYPWICIPTEIWEANTETDFWVEGIRSGDVDSFRVNVRNTYGITKEYVGLRLGHIQTGELKIELK